RIGRLRLLFKLPLQVYGAFASPEYWPTEALAYIHWYTPLTPAPEKDHLMYQVKKMPLRNTNMAPADIIPISSIRQTCQLIPCFGAGVVPEEWRTDNVLDSCDRFFLNNWATKYAYQTLY
ncbi:hypothetical protein C8R48DRAFT_594056, partial [Suillus tomentosus]